MLTISKNCRTAMVPIKAKRVECFGFKFSMHNVVHSFVSETFRALHNSIRL